MTQVAITYNLKDYADFFSEIEKDSNEDNSNMCLISQQPLENNHVTLNCGHKFNYDAIFNDVYNHKKKFMSLETHRLKSYQIRCPYCCNIQNNLLPYMAGKKKVQGVNIIPVQLDDTTKNISTEIYWNMKQPFNTFYKNYAKGYCCYGVKHMYKLLSNPDEELKCSCTLVKYNSIDERVYCKKHLKQYTEHYFKRENTVLTAKIRQEKLELARINKMEKKLLNDKKTVSSRLERLNMTQYNIKKYMNICKQNTNEIKEHKSKKIIFDESDDEQSNNIIITEEAIEAEENEKSFNNNFSNKCIAIVGSTHCQCKRTKMSNSVYCKTHYNIIHT